MHSAIADPVSFDTPAGEFTGSEPMVDFHELTTDVAVLKEKVDKISSVVTSLQGKVDDHSSQLSGLRVWIIAGGAVSGAFFTCFIVFFTMLFNSVTATRNAGLRSEKAQAEQGEQLGEIRKDIKDFKVQIGEDISVLENAVPQANLTLVRLVQNPPANATAIKDNLSDFSERGHITPQLLQYVGARLLDAAAVDHPDVWGAAQAALDLQSSQNAHLAPRPPRTKHKPKYRYQINVKPNPAHPKTRPTCKVAFAGRYASPSKADKSARLEFLSNSNSRRRGSGFSYILVDGYTNTFVLDGMDMKNVILRNADIQYEGGSVSLEDVYFVKCTFNSRFKFTGNSVALGEAIFKGASTSYTSPIEK